LEPLAVHACSRHRRTPAPTAAPSSAPFGSAQSASASSTEHPRKPLILFAFSTLTHHHSHHQFGRRFGIHDRVKSAAEKCLFFFGLLSA
jgi:hypothetical protein